MSESKIAYWGRVDDERLRHETMHDAVEDILDGLPEPLPSHITVFGYARVIIDPFSLNVLDDLIEQLDVEYGDPERCNEVTSTTAAMRRSEHEFVAAVLAEYEPWACQRVTSEEIDVRAWIQEHRPNWLADGVTIEERDEREGEG